MVVGLLRAVVDIYSIVLIVRILFSWLPPHTRDSQFYEFLYSITEPAMRPFRRLIPPMGGFDLSPILLFLALRVIRRLLMGM